ncbi:MAG: hypothetical protein L0220_35465 [Acidobacteria bacterium]|nr:hypothetical protein [Acidobacteriota bacterium]
MTYPLEFSQKFVYRENKRVIFIPLTLISGTETTNCGAKLDTGADFCFFAREHAEEIGLQVEKGTVIRVETNRPEQPMIFYGHEVKIQALGYEIETTVYFWEYHHLPRNLLGRAGWINMFRLALIEHDLELYLSHHDE